MRALREEASEAGQSLNVVVRSALRQHIERRRSMMRLSAQLPAIDALRARIEERAGGALAGSVSLIREDRGR